MPADSIRGEYERHGAEAYYREFGGDYRNPHEPIIGRVLGIARREWELDLKDVLDLAAGSGEATLVLRELGAGKITGIDPYTFAAYERRTGRACERFSFADIAAGGLAGRRYSLIVASFALHLCEPSRLPRLMMKLGEVGEALLVLTPHKRPVIKPEWGWELVGERVTERTRARYYRAGASERGSRCGSDRP